MGHPTANSTLQYLRRFAVAEQRTPDAELLAHYAHHQDDDSFQLLLQRHGPMVLGVCRRVLGPTPDADDAFQATFMALARQASWITENVGGWLHRVALRAAHKVRRHTKPTSLSHDVVDPADPFAHVEWHELRSLLDSELARLPNRFQAPLVLCYLDGLTRDEAAHRLGWSVRTLHRRLEQARRRLQRRLAKHGLVSLSLGALLVEGQLRAEVSSELFRRVQEPSFTGPRVEHFVPASVHRGFAMKTIAATLFVAVIGLGWGIAPRAEADPPIPLPVREPVQLVQAPKKAPLRDPLLDQVQQSKEKAIAYLRKQQDKDGGWEAGMPNLGPQKGGGSALVLLSLLEAGVPVGDPMMKAGLAYVRQLQPTGTYVVSLQTQALCKANQKEDAKLIQANVLWLEKAAARKGTDLLGWSYTDMPGGRGDGSNSRYAIVALYRAHQVGFKVNDKDFWSKVASMYFSTQQANGGWGYVNVGQPTPTMTGSGLVCLWMAHDVLGKQTKESNAAAEKGREWLEDRFKIQQNSTYYYLDILAQLGLLTERRKLTNRDKGIDWYREGASWLVKQQHTDGQFLGSGSYENLGKIGTAFALRFLSLPVD